MTTRQQILRSSTPGQIPAAGTRQPGEVWLNFPDLQLGVIDTSRNAQKLIAVRFFSTSANYAANDIVVQAGAIYVAKGAVTAGAFNSTQWTKIASASDLTAALAAYLPLTGGTLTGALVLAADPGAALGAATKQYVDGKVTAAPFLPIAGGTMTGLVTLSGPPVIPLHAATKAYVDSSAFVPIAGGTMTGPIHSVTNDTIDGAAGTTRSLSSRTGTSPRWELRLANSTAEGGSNAGSDFQVVRYTDAGVAIDVPMTITRATGATSFAANVNFNAPAIVAGAAGTIRSIYGYTVATPRWEVRLANNGAESGGNAGSDFQIVNYSDAGAALQVAQYITRSSGQAGFAIAIVNGPSDRSLKENITPLTGSLERVLKLQGVSFNMLGKTKHREIGLIAQDVAPIVPEILQEFKTDKGEDKLALDYPKLTALLIEAVKSLKAEIDALKAKRAG